MNYKIVSETAGNLYQYKNIPYTCLESEIETAHTLYRDCRGLDVSLMLEQCSSYYGTFKIKTPTIQDWLKSFEKEDVIFALPDANLLSNSYSNAMQAKNLCLKKNPDKKIIVLNTNTTGPGLKLISDHLIHLLDTIESVDEIIIKINKYIQTIQTCILYREKNGLYMISTLKNKKTTINKKTSLLKFVHTIKKSGIAKNKLVLSHTCDTSTISSLYALLKKTLGVVNIEILPMSGINAIRYGKEAIMINYEY